MCEVLALGRDLRLRKITMECHCLAEKVAKDFFYFIVVVFVVCLIRDIHVPNCMQICIDIYLLVSLSL